MPDPTPERRRELLGELTREAVDAGTYGEPAPEGRTPGVPPDLYRLALHAVMAIEDNGAWSVTSQQEIATALAAVLPERERQVREQTLREAADLLDSKPLHCEEHGSVTCTECPVGSDHLRAWADRITRGEDR